MKSISERRHTDAGGLPRTGRLPLIARLEQAPKMKESGTDKRAQRIAEYADEYRS